MRKLFEDLRYEPNRSKTPEFPEKKEFSAFNQANQEDYSEATTQFESLP